MSLTVACAVCAVLLSITGCAGGEPEPTACPLPSLPSLPPSTDGPAGIVPADSIDPRCSGGDLSPTEASELIGDPTVEVTVIDTRTPAEYASGHVTGAVNLSTQDASFWDQVGTLPADGTYILYCRTGSTTRRVMEQMRAIGFGNVCHIETGFNGWQRAGLPVKKGAA